MSKKYLCLSAVMAGSFLFACDGSKPAPEAAATKVEAPKPAPAEAAPAPAAPAAAPAEAPDVAFAKTLDDAKLQKMIAYENELLPHTALIMNVAGGAAMKAGGDGKKMAQELSRDERLKKITEITQGAMAKAGVTESDISGFTTLTAEIIAKEMAIEDARQMVAKKDLMAEMKAIYQQQIDEFEKDRKAFADKYGQSTLEVLDKRKSELIAVRKKQFEIMMGKK
jgi:hypothetical protein